MANLGAYAFCKLCFRDIYASTTCLFVSSTLQMERGVFNCLSEAKRTQFLTGKRSFFFQFFMKNGKFWYIRMLYKVEQFEIS